MPRLSQCSEDENSESRTAVVGLKPRQKGQVRSVPFLSPDSSLSAQSFIMGNSASQPAELQVADTVGRSGLIYTSPTMSSKSPDFGKNRLATGFPRVPVLGVSPGDQVDKNKSNDTSTRALSSGASMDDAIEISDDDQEEQSSDDGGMVINIGCHCSQELSQDMEVDGEEENIQSGQRLEDGHVTESNVDKRDTAQVQASTRRDAHNQLQGDLDRALNSATGKPSDGPASPFVKASSGPRLADLDREEFELQLKYAFFDQDRDDVDLSQPAVCLTCMQSGHAQSKCPEVSCDFCLAEHSSRLCPLRQKCSKCRARGHCDEKCRAGTRNKTVPCDICAGLSHVEQNCPQRFFPHDSAYLDEPVRLWLSCCICSGTSHLVGDCPRVDQTAAARWSLRALAPEQIINLIHEPVNRRIAEQASNRGMRPEGLKIRDRASIHATCKPQSSRYADDDEDEDEEQFLRARVGERNHANQGKITFSSNQLQRKLPDLPSRPATANAGASTKKTHRKQLVQLSQSSSNLAGNDSGPKGLEGPLHLPRKEILRQFVDVINQGRKVAGRSIIELHYRG